MKQQWNAWNDKFLALSSREKWLITLCGLVVTVLLLFTLVIEPAWKQLAAKKEQLSSTIQLNQKLQGDILVIQAKLNKDPNREIDLEMKSLLARSQELGMQLSEVIGNLLSPSQMAELLETVLDKSSGVKLISLESLRAEPIEGNPENSEYSGYYVHPVRLEMTGDFFAIQGYLSKLENLPVKYYWRRFHYQVEEYPQARVVLEVYTLGTRQEFIGG